VAAVSDEAQRVPTDVDLVFMLIDGDLVPFQARGIDPILLFEVIAPTCRRRREQALGHDAIYFLGKLSYLAI
jgi:hypothetical protein